jgi:pyruvate-formate lyase-activating enzyme
MTVAETIRVGWKTNPFLHIDTGRIYNPLTDAALGRGDPEYLEFQAFLRGESPAEGLSRGGWIVRDTEDLSSSYHLKIVSLELMTRCNQKCYFCPVSIAPRDDYEMPEDLFERIVGELTTFKTIEAVFLQSYNEPTLDRRFVEHCRVLHEAGLPVAVLSNGSGLTPARVDALIESAPLRYLCINLSTLDRDRYIEDRGADHLAGILRNLDYLKDKPLAQQMYVAVLGRGDEVHKRDFAEIGDRFAGSRFSIRYDVVMDRAGWLDVGMKPPESIQALGGCDNIGSRPLQHLHITPQGKCVLCCEDYDERYVVGDVATNTLAGILAGPEIARLRRWTYGIEDAPADFICRNCVFARKR